MRIEVKVWEEVDVPNGMNEMVEKDEHLVKEFTITLNGKCRTIGEFGKQLFDQPVFVLMAQDDFSIGIIREYRNAVEDEILENKSDKLRVKNLRNVVKRVIADRKTMEIWRKANKPLCKLPD
jgi:hypothetical protein